MGLGDSHSNKGWDSDGRRTAVLHIRNPSSPETAFRCGIAWRRAVVLELNCRKQEDGENRGGADERVEGQDLHGCTLYAIGDRGEKVLLDLTR